VNLNSYIFDIFPRPVQLRPVSSRGFCFKSLNLLLAFCWQWPDRNIDIVRRSIRGTRAWFFPPQDSRTIPRLLPHPPHLRRTISLCLNLHLRFYSRWASRWESFRLWMVSGANAAMHSSVGIGFVQNRCCCCNTSPFHLLRTIFIYLSRIFSAAVSSSCKLAPRRSLF